MTPSSLTHISPYHHDTQDFDDEFASTIRDVLALDVPTLAPLELVAIYRDQVGTLNEIFDKDLGFSVRNPLIVAPTPSNTPF